MNSPVSLNTDKFPKEQNEHPFAGFVRILGKGKKGSRSLTRQEATEAMGLILDGHVLDLQLGAFLMLLRVKEESPEELAGFVEAAQNRQPPLARIFDVDWSSYAGKKRHPPWFLLSALLLSDNGLRIFMHGADGHTAGRLYTREVMKNLGCCVAESWESVEKLNSNLIYIPLKLFSPRLHDIIQMRSILGLRSPVHSMARLLNPLNSPLVLQGIFHPPYSPIHQQSAELLGYQKTVVIKGEGGEFELNPDGNTQVRSVSRGSLSEEVWPRTFERRHVRPETLSIDHMKQVWLGEVQDEYAETAVLTTSALVLKHHYDLPQKDALALATSWWRDRDRNLLLPPQ